MSIDIFTKLRYAKFAEQKKVIFRFPRQKK